MYVHISELNCVGQQNTKVLNFASARRGACSCIDCNWYRFMFQKLFFFNVFLWLIGHSL